MKQVRRLFAFALTLFMALAIMPTAFAQDNGTITIKNAQVGESYGVYKLFDATVGTNGKIAYTLPANKDVANDTTFNKYFEIQNGNVVKKDALNESVLKTDEFQNWAKEFNTTASDSKKASSSTVIFEGLDYGYYYITSTVPGGVVTIDSTNPAAEVIDKNETVTFDKNIVLADDTLAKVNEAGLNIDVNFDITVNTKNYEGDQKVFMYVVNDTMDPGFSLKAAPVVKVGTSTLATDKYTISYTKAGEATTNVTEADAFVITIPWTNDSTKDGDHLYDNNDVLNVTYKAILDPAKAASSLHVGASSNDNTADVKFYKGEDTPGHPSGDLPDQKTETYDTKITIQKNDGDGQALPGAGFTLTTTDGTGVVLISTDEVFTEDVEGTYYKLNDGTYTTEAPNGEQEHDADYDSTETKYTKNVTTSVKGAGQTETAMTATVGNDGKLSFTGLGVGTYTLEETTVPDGYNKAGNVVFTISFNPTTKKFTSNNENVTVDGNANVLATTVVNNKGTELPSTGGIGTTIFYVVGGVMVAGAAIFLLTKRRMAGNAE